VAAPVNGDEEGERALTMEGVHLVDVMATRGGIGCGPFSPFVRSEGHFVVRDDSVCAPQCRHCVSNIPRTFTLSCSRIQVQLLKEIIKK
jgi:hypothetical protein